MIWMIWIAYERRYQAATKDQVDKKTDSTMSKLGKKVKDKQHSTQHIYTALHKEHSTLTTHTIKQTTLHNTTRTQTIIFYTTQNKQHQTDNTTQTPLYKKLKIMKH